MARKFSQNFKRHTQRSLLSSNHVETTILCHKLLDIPHRICPIFPRARNNLTTVSNQSIRIRSSNTNNKMDTTSQSLNISTISSRHSNSLSSLLFQTTIWTINFKILEISIFPAPNSNLQVQNSYQQIESHTEHQQVLKTIKAEDIKCHSAIEYILWNRC